jgi:hypothetical protein
VEVKLLTHSSFYGKPLRAIIYNLKHQNILQDVQVLVLDGLCVRTDLISEIIVSNDFNIRLLSIRGVQSLNIDHLQLALKYAVRPSRPLKKPKLQGIYLFGRKDSKQLTNRKIPTKIESKSTHPASDNWFGVCGNVLPDISQDLLRWSSVIEACRDIICFDAVLCNGPRHSSWSGPEEKRPWYHYSELFLGPSIATYSLSGCNECKSASEGFARWGLSSTDRFPLLAPPPLYFSTMKAAKVATASTSHEKKLLLRCKDCLKDRYCECCHKWWCEDCCMNVSEAYFLTCLFFLRNNLYRMIQVKLSLYKESCD